MYKHVQAVHHPFVARQPSQAEQDSMVSVWTSWAATCQRGTPEGKAQCLSMFASLQKLHEVPDAGWVRMIKDEVLV